MSRQDTSLNNEMHTGYAVKGWEREFSSAANAAVCGYDIVAPSLKGNSGIFEGGLSFNYQKGLDFSTEIGIVGCVGYKKRRDSFLKLNYSV